MEICINFVFVVIWLRSTIFDLLNTTESLFYKDSQIVR